MLVLFWHSRATSSGLFWWKLSTKNLLFFRSDFTFWSTSLDYLVQSQKFQDPLVANIEDIAPNILNHQKYWGWVWIHDVRKTNFEEKMRKLRKFNGEWLDVFKHYYRARTSILKFFKLTCSQDSRLCKYTQDFPKKLRMAVDLTPSVKNFNRKIPHFSTFLDWPSLRFGL